MLNTAPRLFKEKDQLSIVQCQIKNAVPVQTQSLLSTQTENQWIFRFSFLIFSCTKCLV